MNTCSDTPTKYEQIKPISSDLELNLQVTMIYLSLIHIDVYKRQGWIEYIKDWDNSHQKLEWNCRGNDDGDIKDVYKRQGQKYASPIPPEVKPRID